MIARFGKTTDHRQAFFILRNRRQTPDETIQAFSDELFTLSRKAYPNLRGHEAFIEGPLPKCITQKMGEITVTLAIPQVDKANLMLEDLIIRETKTPLS